MHFAIVNEECLKRKKKNEKDEEREMNEEKSVNAILHYIYIVTKKTFVICCVRETTNDCNKEIFKEIDSNKTLNVPRKS